MAVGDSPKLRDGGNRCRRRGVVKSEELRADLVCGRKDDFLSAGMWRRMAAGIEVDGDEELAWGEVARRRRLSGARRTGKAPTAQALASRRRRGRGSRRRRGVLRGCELGPSESLPRLAPWRRRGGWGLREGRASGRNQWSGGLGAVRGGRRRGQIARRRSYGHSISGDVRRGTRRTKGRG